MNLAERIQLTKQTLDAMSSVYENHGAVPDGKILEFAYDHGNSAGMWQNAIGPHSIGQGFYRLVDATKTRIPLTMDDVPAGSVFSANPEVGYVSPHVDYYGIEFRSDKKDFSYSWAELMERGFQIKRPGEDWAPCSKEAT